MSLATNDRLTQNRKNMSRTFSALDFRGIILTVCKLLAIILLLAVAPWAWIEIFSYGFDAFVRSNRVFYALGYTIIFWTAVVSMPILPFIRNAYARIPLVIVIIVAYAADQMFLDITGYHLNLADVRTIWWERGASLDQFSMFATHFGGACLWVIGAGVILGLAPARSWALKLRWSSVPLFALGAISGVIPYTKGGTQDFPPAFALPAMFGFVAATTEFVNIADVEYEGPIKPLATHIVFIVDESIRGDVMGLNQSDIDNTPFLMSQKNRLINFGVAVAGGNCSSISRTMLRYGLRREDVRESGLTRLARPPIWKYARRAGFRTILIEARRGEQAFYYSEWPSIDRYILETDAPTYARDGLIAERLIALLKEDVPSFIFVNKFGAHIPYESAYPPEFNEFPWLSQNRASGLTSAEPSVFNAGTREHGGSLRTNYSKAIFWDVDGFFRALLNQFDNSRVLLVYTSDHGQSLMDGGQKISHCTTTTQQTQIGEGLVPLLAFTGIPELDGRLRENAKRAYGHATHFEIFPTLLLAMGYEEKWVRMEYGRSLLEVPANQRRQFLIMGSGAIRGWFDGAKWVPVD
jgi:lipid A ethanolaminephosphotransferase